VSRRVFLVALVGVAALVLLFVQNKVMVGSQELTVTLDRPEPAVVALTFKDVAGRPVNFQEGGGAAFEELREAVAKRLAGNEKRALKAIEIVPDSFKPLPDGHGFTFKLVDDTVSPKDLVNRLQSTGFRQANPAHDLFHVNLGIDLRGGVEFTARLYNRDNQQVPADEVVVGILRRRLDARGLTEPQVFRLTSGEVQVVIPGGTQADAARTRKVLETTGRLEIREVKSVLQLAPNSNLSVRRPNQADFNAPAADVGNFLVEQDNGTWNFGRDYREVGVPRKPFIDVVYPEKPAPGTAPAVFYHLGKAVLTGEDVQDAFPTNHEGEVAVGITFTAAGGATNQVFGERIKADFEAKKGLGLFAISMDGTVESAPFVRSAAGANAVITGRFTSDEVDSLRTVLKAGSLAVTPRVTSERVVGPSLGQETIAKGAWSMLAGLGLILVIMWGYYRMRLGTVAIASLATTVVLVFVVLSIFGATLTLPGLAGLVLTVGMAVDANILIFERLREEIHDDVDVATGIENGYGRAFITILDANLTTFLTALILYVVGTGPIQGFGLTLMVGILTSMFGALYVGRMTTEWFYRGKESVKIPGFIKDVRLPYTKYRWLVLPVSGLLLIASAVEWFGVGDVDAKFDIDFTGGHMVQVTFTEPLDNQQVRTILGDAAAAGEDLLDPSAIQLLPYFADFTQAGTASRQWMFKGRDLEGARIERERASKEDELAATTRDITRLQGDEQENGVKHTEELRTLGKQASGLRDVIATLTARVEDQQVAFQEQLRGAFDAYLANEGDEIEALSWDGETLHIELTLIGAPDADRLQEAAARLEARDEIITATVTAGADSAKPSAVISLTYETAPAPLTDLIRKDAIMARAQTLLGEASNDVMRGRLSQAAEVYDLSVETLASAAIAVDQPFPSSQHFSPLVGDQMKGRALWAMLIAIAAILAYIAARFEFRYGLGAIIALVHDVVITVGLLDLMDVHIDLTVIAALLTIIGYSLNDTIVVFDRIRENIAKMQLGLKEIIDISIAQTMSRTILTSLTTIAVVLILVLFGGEGVNSFSVALLVGLLLGTYSSVFVAAPILVLLNKGKPASALVAEALAEPDPNAIDQEPLATEVEQLDDDAK
jgi:SecD/SecF fusion protein